MGRSNDYDYTNANPANLTDLDGLFPAGIREGVTGAPVKGRCKQLRKEIAEKAGGIKSKFRDMEVNRLAFQRGDRNYQRHVDNIRGQQKKLRKLIDEFRCLGCAARYGIRFKSSAIYWANRTRLPY